jgi:tetratricopeptide (TPR) repeat protein
MRLRGQPDKALEEVDSAIKSKDMLLPAYLEKSSLLLSRGDLEGAQGAISELMKRDRENVLGRAAMAKILALRQKPQDALQEAEAVLAVQPNNEDALMARGEAYLSLSRLKDAKEEFRKLTELRPSAAVYWHRLGQIETQQGDTASGLAHFRKALEIQPETPLSLNNILYLLLRANKFDEAMAEVDKLSKTAAPQDQVHIFRGRLYVTRKEYGPAEQEFRKALEVNPKNYEPYLHLGQMNIQRNDVQQALKEVDQLIARDAKFPPAYLLKAFYQQAANDNQGAITSYRKVLELMPEDAVAANNLAWLLCERGTNLDEALKLAQLAKKKAPENPEIADTLGWVYYKLKNYTLAADQLLFSVNNRQPPQAEHYYRLGMAYYGKGDLTLARQTLRKALEMSASFPGADEARQILKAKPDSR